VPGKQFIWGRGNSGQERGPRYLKRKSSRAKTVWGGEKKKKRNGHDRRLNFGKRRGGGLRQKDLPIGKRASNVARKGRGAKFLIPRGAVCNNKKGGDKS